VASLAHAAKENTRITANTKDIIFLVIFFPPFFNSFSPFDKLPQLFL
jgi:hypothetical protein